MIFFIDYFVYCLKNAIFKLLIKEYKCLYMIKYLSKRRLGNMNFVVLAPEAIYPPNTGGRILVYNRVKYLAELGHRIDVFVIVDNNQESELLKRINIHPNVYLKAYNRNKHKLYNLITALINPYCVSSRTNKKLMKDLHDFTEQHNIDYILVEQPQMLNTLKKICIKDIGIILDQQNIEYMTMMNISHSLVFFKKCIYQIESKRLKKYEEKHYKSQLIDLYTFVSDTDKCFFEDNLNYNNKPTYLFPIGAEKNCINKKKNNQTKNIIIVRKMSYPPNIEGVLWFYNNVWKELTNVFDDLCLYIVGKDPTNDLLKLRSDNVIVTGTVDSVNCYYELADVVCIPIFSGGGVKTKLIEASSYGVPIVSTTNGVKGTAFKHKEHMYITDDPNLFKEYIINCLDNDDDIRMMIEKCYLFFENNYTWEGICKKFLQYLTGDNL